MDLKAIAGLMLAIVVFALVLNTLFSQTVEPTPEPETLTERDTFVYEMLYYTTISIREGLYSSDSNVFQVITPVAVVEFDKTKICGGS